MLAPRSIAVIGGKPASAVIRQCAKMGYAGKIFAIHPSLTEMEGVPVFPQLADLPIVPDAAFIGVNRRATIGVAAALSAMGCTSAIAYAAGFAEAGDAGRVLQTQLLQAAGGMKLFGPNCYGYLNYFDDIALWPDQYGGKHVTHGVAIITQSGNIGLNMTMQQRGLPVGYVLTLGNQAGMDHAACIEAVLDDPRVTAIGLHIEAISNAATFVAAVARAHAQKIPIAVLKTGCTAQGAAIAYSHTASLGGADQVMDAFLRRLGVARVNTIPALLETLKVLHVHGGLPSACIASLSCSGGEAALIADEAARAGVQFAPVTQALRQGLSATLPDLVAISNPLDYHTFGWAHRHALAATFAAMMRSDAALTLLILDFPRGDQCSQDDWKIAALALKDAAAQTGRAAALLATLPEALPEDIAQTYLHAGIVPLHGMAEAMQAIAAAATCQGLQASTMPALLPDRTSDGAITPFSEFVAKQMLKAHSVPVPAGAVAHDVAGAHALAATLEFPLAVKACGADLAHKSEMGAVRLNLRDLSSLAHAAETLLAVTGEILVEQMVAAPVAELIIGAARDPVFGLYMLIGSGGVLAELVGDTVIMPLPAGRQQIEAALSTLRVHKLLAGYRGAPVGDIAACIEAIFNIERFILAQASGLIELDVNPLIVCAEGHGAFAADAFLRMHAGEADE